MFHGSAILYIVQVAEFGQGTQFLKKLLANWSSFIQYFSYSCGFSLNVCKASPTSCLLQTYCTICMCIGLDTWSESCTSPPCILWPKMPHWSGSRSLISSPKKQIKPTENQPQNKKAHVKDYKYFSEEQFYVLLKDSPWNLTGHIWVP